MRRPSCFLLMPLLLLTATLASAQSNDEAYGEKIWEYTTDERFLNDMVDHLPHSETVPSPLDHFGTIIGAPGILHYTHEIYGYLRALADASPRVQVRSIGRTEEDREMIEVIIADEAGLANLEAHRADLNRLADPRGLSEAEAQTLIDRGLRRLLRARRKEIGHPHPDVAITYVLEQLRASLMARRFDGPIHQPSRLSDEAFVREALLGARLYLKL